MTEEEIDSIGEEYARKFGRHPPICMEVPIDEQAKWWKECIAKGDRDEPLKEGYEAFPHRLDLVY